MVLLKENPSICEISDNVALDKDNLWTSILNNVHTHNNKKLPVGKNVLVLGDNEAGKTTFVAKLQGIDDPKKGWGLEYAYILVTDEYRDDHTRLGFWILDGHENYSGLLNFALNEETFANTLVIIAVSMTAPWSIMDQLQKWTRILSEHLSKLKIDPTQMEQFRQKVINNWTSYVEPNDDMNTASPMKRSSIHFPEFDPSVDPDAESVTLGDGVLVNNLGLDIIVLVTKTDYISILEKDYYFKDEMLDFMQQWIRRYCLEYGAALFYMSAKEDKNCDVLYKYLLHRIYGFSFKTPALVVEKDAIFIPMGWDSMRKISILYENIHLCHPDDDYNSVIMPPFKQTSVNELEVVAEDEQEFLSQRIKILQAAKEKLASENSGDATNIDSNTTPTRPMNVAKMSPRMSGSPMYHAAQKNTDIPKSGSTNNETNLIEFFNNLLTKKVGPSKQNSTDLGDKKNSFQKSDSSDA